jgi:hypothetical protein
VLGPLAPLAAGSPAHATHCAPGARLVTTNRVYYPVIAPSAYTPFSATGGTPSCAVTGVLTGHCPAVTVVGDGSTITLQADVGAGESCHIGATQFVIVSWTP